MSQLNRSAGMGLAILQKELIVRMRRFRSLIVQLIFAAILGGAMWLFSLTAAYSFGYSPEDHAQELVVLYFGLQATVIFLVIPALGAVSITTEKLGRTWDLLVGTDLSPGEIVRGKLLGILSITFYFLLLPAPLLALTTLFGGVSIGSILFEYLVHMLLAALLGSVSIFSSAASKGTVRALLQVYPVIGFSMLGFMGFLANEVYSDGYLLLDYLLVTGVVPEVWLVTLAIIAFVFFGSLQGATYFLSGKESAREIPIRILYMLLFLTLGAIFTYSFIMYTSPTSRSFSLSGDFGWIIVAFALITPVSLLRLAGSETRVPLRVAQIYQRKNLRTKLGYFIFPGGIRNLAYAVFCYSIMLAMALYFYNYEQSLVSGVSLNFDTERYAADMSRFESQMYLSVLWGMSLLGMCWFFAQLGFGGVVSAVLTFGIHVALAMFVITVTIAAGLPESGMLTLSLLSPPMVVVALGSGEAISQTQIYYASLSSIGIFLVCLVAGILVARAKKNPIFLVARPGLDALYLDLPEESA
ncbi:MAG: hypothetical protein AAEJ04_02595 [Planctomycetota bacterium]